MGVENNVVFKIVKNLFCDSTLDPQDISSVLIILCVNSVRFK